MKYVQSTLIHGEKIVYQAHVSKWAMGPRIAVGVLVLFAAVMAGRGGEVPVAAAVLAVLGAIPIVGAFLACSTTELALTNKRVIAKFGLLRRETIELKVARVESVQVRQGILGRLFGYGSLIVAAAGTPCAPIPGISSPMLFRSMIFEAQESAEIIPLKRAA